MASIPAQIWQAFRPSFRLMTFSCRPAYLAYRCAERWPCKKNICNLFIYISISWSPYLPIYISHAFFYSELSWPDSRINCFWDASRQVTTRETTENAAGKTDKMVTRVNIIFLTETANWLITNCPVWVIVNYVKVNRNLSEQVCHVSLFCQIYLDVVMHHWLLQNLSVLVLCLFPFFPLYPWRPINYSSKSNNSQVLCAT